MRIHRRSYLGISTGIGNLAGCLGDETDGSGDEATANDERTGTTSEPDPDVIVTYDPYEPVDWEEVEQHSTDIHFHTWKGEGLSGHEIIDLVTTQGYPTPRTEKQTGYNIFAVSADGRPQGRDDAPSGCTDEGWDLYFPWEEAADLCIYPGTQENRDPVETDCVAFRCREFGYHPDTFLHLHSLFGEHAERGMPSFGNDRDAAIDWAIDEAGPGAVIVAHPHADGLNAAIMDEFDRYSREDGLLGIEGINFKGDGLHIWDELLERYLPERDPIFNFAASDFQHGPVIGQDIFRWETVVLADAGTIDPSDQDGSREIIREAFYAGRVFSIRRDAWDDETDEPPAVPVVEEIEMGEDNIRIQAVNADRIEWISKGAVVAEGPTIDLDFEHTPYVRAHLKHFGPNGSTEPTGETFTQPWRLES